MTPIVIGIVVFVCTFGGASLGMKLRFRLPGHHLDSESKDAVKLVAGLVATMTALVLGLVTASEKASFDAVDAAVRQTAVNLLALDRALVRYGPETVEIRKELRDVVAARINTFWDKELPITNNPNQAPKAMASVEDVVEKVRAMQPLNDAQRGLQSRALDLGEAALQIKWQLIAGTASSVPEPFLVILVFWLTTIFFSFGLFAPRNNTVVFAHFLGALSVASSLFLVLEMEEPFSGLMQVSSVPLLHAYENLGK